MEKKSNIMLNKSIVNVSMQSAHKRHKVVPPIFYGGLYSSLNGVFVYDNTSVELSVNKKLLRIDMKDICKVTYSLAFRKHSVRSLPTMMAYIDITIRLKDQRSFEINTLDYHEVLPFNDILKEQNISVIDEVNVLDLLTSVEDKEDGFYHLMLKNGEKVANKYKLDYPSITFDRRIGDPS